MAETKTPRSDRFFRLLLRLFPFDFRGDFGSEMEDVFREQRRDAARQGGRFGLARLWWRTLQGIVRTALRQHVDMLAQDLVYTFRVLRRSPGFTATATLTLALGVGANSAIFSVVDAVLLRPLPVRDPDRLAVILEQRSTGLNHNLSYPDYVDYRDHNPVFSDVIAYSPIDLAVAAGDDSQRISAEVVTAHYFSALGVRPVLGRTFLPEEAEPPHHGRVVVLAKRAWDRFFPGSHDVQARTVAVNGRRYAVVGVIPDSFKGMVVGGNVEAWAPMSVAAELLGVPESTVTGRRMNWLTLVGRLKPAVSMKNAEAGLNAFERHSAGERPGGRPRVLRLAPGGQGDSMLPEMLFVPLVVLAVVVGLVLLIACANIANLLLARAGVRRKEIGMRLALGAGRGRLVRQLLTENFVLAVLGGTAGLAVAAWTSRLLVSYAASDAAGLEVRLDARVLGFTLLVAVLASLAFGLVPALRASALAVADSIKDTDTSPRRRLFRSVTAQHTLVVFQTALTLVLLVGAGLFVRTLQNLRGLDVGFRTGGVLLASVDLGLNRYDTQRGRDFYARLATQLKRLPGVRQVGLASIPPVNGGGSRTTVAMQGYQPGPDEDTELNFNTVDAGYFAAMGIPIVRGRGFDGRDVRGAPQVAVIDETMARRYWRGQDPIGKRVGFQGPAGPFETEIVGVARDVKYRTLREGTEPSFYLSLDQAYRPFATVHVVTAGDPLALASAVAREVKALDPALPLFNVRSLDEQLDRAMGQERMAAAISGLFGALALVLAAVGLSGVLSYSVARRTREMGVRIALGARPSEVRRLVLGEGLVFVAVGAAIGLALALPLMRLVGSLLYGVTPSDAWTLASSVALVFLVALFASDLPARRATRVDPVTALRAE
jgi:putative ABC transport system permease protein